LPLGSPKGGSNQKRKTAVFGVKSHFALRKCVNKVSLCENCQQQSCKAFIGLTICAKLVGGGRPLLPEIFGQTYHVGAKSLHFVTKLILTPAVNCTNCDCVIVSAGLMSIARRYGVVSEFANVRPACYICDSHNADMAGVVAVVVL